MGSCASRPDLSVTRRGGAPRSVGRWPISWARPVAPGAVRLPADDEGLHVVPAVAVGGIRDALLELSEEVGEETGGAVLALAREGAEEEGPAPCGHAPHVAPREHGGIVVPVG